jgi:tRNA uridine 5-carbamoylmethylation protein Kti12
MHSIPHKNSPSEDTSPADKVVIIMRGLPGSGKSSNAKHWEKIVPDDICICSADDYFMQNGEYVFDPLKLKDAHKACFQKFQNALDNPYIHYVFVDNTNTEEWQMMPYIKESLAKKDSGVSIAIYIQYFPCTVEDSFKRNTHNVPLHTIERMQRQLEASVNQDSDYWNLDNGKIVYRKNP